MSRPCSNADCAPQYVILEDLDRAFPTEGKRTQEWTVSFRTLLNCLDGVGTQDGVIVVATANDPTCLDPAILKRPGRFDRVVQFRNPDADLRREYYRRLSLILTGEQFEVAIENTEGFSFAQLRETLPARGYWRQLFRTGKNVAAPFFHVAQVQRVRPDVWMRGHHAEGRGLAVARWTHNR
jgi:AAA+ superfamily predicted ATPase